MPETLFPFFIAAVLLSLSPGPDILYVLVLAVTKGRKPALITVLGLVSGIVVHTSLVAFGVSVLIKESEIIYIIIKFAGAFYLFFLAYQEYRSDAKIQLTTQHNIQQKSWSKLFVRGFFMNVLNPKIIIFFLAFFPGFLWDTSENTVLQFYILGLLFMVQAFILFSLVAILAGKVSTYLQHKRAAVFLKWLQVVVYLGIGLFILF